MHLAISGLISIGIPPSRFGGGCLPFLGGNGARATVISFGLLVPLEAVIGEPVQVVVAGLAVV